jgi:hypothetical protein
MFKKPPSGWLGSTVASVIGGGGGALLGGILANQQLVKPETAGMLMTAAGSVGGIFSDGHTRTAMHGLAGAGAGQLALAVMAKQATPKNEAKNENAPQVAANTPPQLPGQTAPQPSLANSRYGAGPVWSAFRDAAGELEVLDDDDAREFEEVYVDADGQEVDLAA